MCVCASSHADGSVKFWDASQGTAFMCLSILSFKDIPVHVVPIFFGCTFCSTKVHVRGHAIDCGVCFLFRHVQMRHCTWLMMNAVFIRVAYLGGHMWIDVCMCMCFHLFKLSSQVCTHCKAAISSRRQKTTLPLHLESLA